MPVTAMFEIYFGGAAALPYITVPLMEGVPAAVGVAVGVFVGVPHGPSELNMRENRRIEPESRTKLSLTFNIQVPSALCPSKVLSIPVVSGEKSPCSGGPPFVSVEIFGKPPSSFMFVKHILWLDPPRSSWNVTDVAAGDVSLNIRSPIYV